MKLNESITFPYVEKGSNYLIKEFPNEKNYEETNDVFPKKRRRQKILTKNNLFPDSASYHYY